MDGDFVKILAWYDNEWGYSSRCVDLLRFLVKKGPVVLRTVKDVDLRGKRVFIRVDFNVPLKDGRITDDTRIRASLPTIEYALENGAKVDPARVAPRTSRKGSRTLKYSLQPVRQAGGAPRPAGEVRYAVEAGFSRLSGLNRPPRKPALQSGRGKERSRVRRPTCVPWRTSISMMRSDPRIARTRQPRGSSGTSKSRRRGC